MRILFFFVFFLFFTFEAAAEEAPIPVTTKPLSELLIERKLSANAQVMALNESQLSAEVMAVVDAILVDVGDEVKIGDDLIQLSDVDLRLQYQQAQASRQSAEARLAQAELRLERANELQMSQYISADDLLARKTDVAVFKADLKGAQVAERIAQRQLEKTTIKAPFDGVVTGRQGQQGQLLQVSSPVLKLTQTEGAEVHAKIPAHLAPQLAEADRMLFTQNGMETAVKLIQLSSVVESQAAIQLARFVSDQPLSVGQTGQLIWYVKGRLLSADVVLKRSGQLGVFVAENGQAKFMALPDAQEGRPVPMDISSMDGTSDWQVIIGGRERLQDGQAIRVK